MECDSLNTDTTEFVSVKEYRSPPRQAQGKRTRNRFVLSPSKHDYDRRRMSLAEKLKDIACTLRQRLAFYTVLYQDPRTPRLARLFLWAALAYAAMPFDLIPDFLPIIGHLDDVIIVPGLIFLAVRLIPVAVYDEHWQRAFGES